MKLRLKYFSIAFVFLFSSYCGLAQTANISGVINNYASVTGIGAQSVSVPAVSGFAVGNKVILIQMKGATIDLTNTSGFGTITSYNDAGNYEMLEVSSIAGTTITFVNPISRTYSIAGIVQLVKVPVYNNVNVTGALTCLPWNGSTGGVLAFEATGNVTLNAAIDVNGKGFLGGTKAFGQFISCVGNLTDFVLPASSLVSANKGEGIAITTSSIAKGLGAMANGGGAGNDVNGGGAGGGNFGMGGHGGNNKCSTSPTTLCGGLEGKNCTYSNAVNKIFLGGGGGAGHENDGVSTGGAAGGGIIIIRAAGAILGNGNFITANGKDNTLVAGNDGQGGGGAGGTVLIEACSTVALNVSVKGGYGGTDNFTGPDCHGKGGGGGGGIIWTTTALPYTSFLNGGNPGVFTSPNSQCFNTSNGATVGQTGGTLTGLVIPGTVPFPVITASLSLSSTCFNSVGSATASVITNIGSPNISYTWTNSSSAIISQTTNTTALTNTVTNLVNGVYTLSVQINPPCGPVYSQTININCVPTSTSCSGNLGAPVFLEDFGSGTSLYGPALAPGITNYPYLQGVPNNGTYVIASSSNPSGTNAGYVDDNRDHTGNTNGYMMVVNSDYAASDIYRRHVTGLCPGTTYVFSAYLANNNSPAAITSVCAGNYVYANIKFQVEYPLGTVQGSVTSGNLQAAPTSTALPWIQYGFVFTTGPGQTTVDVVLKNNAPGGCGNDYAVDDISLSPCGPGVGLTIAQNKTVFCEGEPVTLQSAFTSGGYTSPQYQWQYSSNGGATWSDISGATSPNYNISAATFLQTGMYQLMVAENGNISLPSCRIIAGPLTFTVVNSLLTVSSATICNGAPATLTVTGATSYTWSNGSNSSSINVNPSVTTSYTVDGATGTCTSQAVSTVSVLPSATISVSPAQALICAGESVTLTATGFSTYTWTPGTNLSSNTGSMVVASPVTTTIYTVTGAAGSCTNTTTATITAISVPTIVTSPNTVICSGMVSSATLIANGAISYTWSNSSSLSSPTGSNVIATPNTTTSYTVTGSVGSCTNSAVVTVSVNSSPTITAVSIDPTSCGLANGSATVTSVPSSNSYTWSSGVPSVVNTASPLSAGNYTVTANNGSCQTSTVIAIAGSVPLLITSVTVTPSGCSSNNGSIVIRDNLAGSSYSWSPNVATTGNAGNLSSGDYSLTITNGACSTSTVLSVGLINGPDGFEILSNNAFCAYADGSFTITSITGGLAPYLYSFNSAGFSATTSYTNLSYGTYFLTVIDANNCLYTNTVSIGKTTVSTVSDITINAPNCFENDGSVIINSISGGTAPYLVNPNHTAYTPNRVYEQLGQGTYTFSVLDSNGCVTDNIILMPENNGEYTLYVPNTFTPNNDRVNDIWYAQGTCIQEFKCQIFNRWGEKISEFNDIKEGWDGTCKGQRVPDDVYVYLIKATVYQETITKRGHVTVLK